MTAHEHAGTDNSPESPGPAAGRAMEILLVEDNPADVRLTREVFGRGPVACRVSVAEDGDAALQFLRRETPYELAPRPDIVLLDLNLPRMSGRELLTRMRSDPLLEGLPVIILTSSAAEDDVRTGYRLHANSYIVKPGDYAAFVGAVRGIESFWLRLARLPGE